MSDLIRTSAVPARSDAQLLSPEYPALITDLVAESGGIVIITEDALQEVDDLEAFTEAIERELHASDETEEEDTGAYLYCRPGYISDEGDAKIPANLQPGINDAVRLALEELEIGTGICWIYSLAVAASTVLGRDFPEVYEEITRALGIYTQGNLYAVNPELPSEVQLSLFKQGIRYVVGEDGGLNIDMFDPRNRDGLVYLFNLSLKANNIPVFIEYADMLPALMQCRNRIEAERLMLKFFAEQARKGKGVTFVMEVRNLQRDSSGAPVAIVGPRKAHMACVNGVYRSEDGKLYVGVSDLNYAGQVYIPARYIGGLFFGGGYFPYDKDQCVRYSVTTPLLIVSAKQRRTRARVSRGANTGKSRMKNGR